MSQHADSAHSIDVSQHADSAHPMSQCVNTLTLHALPAGAGATDSTLYKRYVTASTSGVTSHLLEATPWDQTLNDVTRSRGDNW